MTDPIFSDESTRLVGDGIEPDEYVAPTYPDTTVGMLMRQRDEAQASADSDRLFASQMLDRAAATDKRVAQLKTAIAALGGEPT